MDLSLSDTLLKGLLTATNDGMFGVGTHTLAAVLKTSDELIRGTPGVGFLKQLMFGVTFMLILGIIFVRRARSTLTAKIPVAAVPLEAPAASAEGPYRNRWNEIQQRMESTRETEWRVAVIEADKLIDAALRNAGFGGDSLGDRLMALEPGQLVTLDGLWFAHKIRNRIAHDVNHFLRYAEARQAMMYYQATLEELKAI